MLYIHTKNYIRLKIFFNPEYSRAICKISLTWLKGKLVRTFIIWPPLSLEKTSGGADVSTTRRHQKARHSKESAKGHYTHFIIHDWPSLLPWKPNQLLPRRPLMVTEYRTLKLARLFQQNRLLAFGPLLRVPPSLDDTTYLFRKKP
jgi:hypothetical protein